jgi:hypothetical protein
MIIVGGTKSPCIHILNGGKKNNLAVNLNATNSPQRNHSFIHFDPFEYEQQKNGEIFLP